MRQWLLSLNRMHGSFGPSNEGDRFSSVLLCISNQDYMNEVTFTPTDRSFRIYNTFFEVFLSSVSPIRYEIGLWSGCSKDTGVMISTTEHSEVMMFNEG